MSQAQDRLPGRFSPALPWNKGGLHYLLTNEAYTGTAVWGRTSKGEKTQDPVRVDAARPALVSRELFHDAQQAMRARAPKVQRPARAGSKFLLSGLLKCGVCGRPYRAQGAKSGQFAYYICGTLFKEGAGTCSARYLNAPRLEAFVVEKIRERILNEETIVALVTIVAEEIDAMAGELAAALVPTVDGPVDFAGLTPAGCPHHLSAEPVAVRPLASFGHRNLTPGLLGQFITALRHGTPQPASLGLRGAPRPW